MATIRIPTPEEEFMVAIARWEGKWQAFPSDPGNYLGGRLIGTMRGVTPPVLKVHLGITDDSVITPEFMQQTVTLKLAAEIGVRRFYKGWIDPIHWNACASVVTDFGWGSGPGQAVKSNERDFLHLDHADFRFDQASIAAWRDRHDTDGVEKMLWEWYGVRERFYDLICMRNPALQKFRTGWHNRATWQTPKSAEWFDHWRGASTDDVIGEVDKLDPEPMPKAVLGVGSRGADVLAVQKRLVELGFKLSRSLLPNGQLDGIFGPELKHAVLAFQSTYKPKPPDPALAVDGWVGDLTRRALFGTGRLFGT